MLLHRFKLALRDFAADETGLITAEAVIAMPFLVWWYVGSLVFFDAYQARNVNLKAAYTVSDMLSREDSSVNAAYIEGLDGVYSYLTTGHGTNAKVRVTLVRCTSQCGADEPNRVLALDWSYGTDNLAALTDGELGAYDTHIPIMPAGDRVIMVETFIDYEPAWDVGIVNPTDFDNIIVTRPRFMPQIPWSNS